MDTLTHLLAGAAIAALLPGKQRPDPLGLTTRGARRREFLPDVAPHSPATQYGSRLACAILGSLAPDLDVLVNPYGDEAAGLAYMLLHRGYTHTVLGGVLMATAIAAVAGLIRRTEKGRAFAELCGITALALLLHGFMDWTNDYGLHPLSPFYDRWIYGDFIFLVEPLLWFALLPMAIAPMFRDKGSRAVNVVVALLLVLLTLGSLGFVWFRFAQGEWVTLLPAVFGTVWWVAQLWAYGRWASRWVGWGSVLAVWAVFFSTSRATRHEAIQALERQAPDEQHVQITTTPAPSNPLCFRVVTASYQRDAGEIRTRLGTYSLWPSLVSPADCFTAARRDPPNAQLTASDLKDDPGWHWRGVFRGDLATFEGYARDCERVSMTKAFLRAPFWADRGEQGVVIGDLRLDYARDLAKYCKFRYQTDRPASCEWSGPHVAWEPPFFSKLVTTRNVAVAASASNAGNTSPAAN
jgi:inner membrane protein